MVESGKQEYSKPVLVSYGSIEKITLSGAVSNMALGNSDWDTFAGGGSGVSVS